MDGRYRYDTNQGNFNRADNFGDWILSAGIQIPFGGAAAPTTRKLELSADTLFAFNKSQLSARGVSEINSLSRDLDQVSYESVEVAGHTDPIGSDEYNRRLSEDRADSVKGQLVQDGVPAGRVSTYGMGESQLKVTPEDCAGATSRQALIECYQPNRRVEVTVSGVTEK
jgi:OOP family OmpA-OmpF porin